MNGFVLAFVACLASSPKDCRLVEIPIDRVSCAYIGQQMIVRWLAWNPGYVTNARHACRLTGTPT